MLEFASLVDRRLTPDARKVVSAYEKWTTDGNLADLLSQVAAVT